ncbi:MAG: rod shape-determining protein MreB [Myxococcota bacterium]|jgi:rod shape-determining protein MreB
MFSAVLGLFSQDLAVDLGTSETRIHQRGTGLVCREPSVIAVHTDRNGHRRVAAVGSEAVPMIGRTPADLQAVQPVQHGHVVDFEVAEALLTHLVRQVHGRNQWVAPKMVLATPWGATDMERRALRESCETSGARVVHLVDRPLAAAFGAELPVERATGNLVVDLGAGEASIALLSLCKVVAHQSVPGGGNAIDIAIMRMVRDRYDLCIGRSTAERLKLELADASGRSDKKTSEAKGRCGIAGIPHAVTVTGADIADALQRPVTSLVRGIRAVLDRVPAELARDVADHGVVLVGGGARLRGLERVLREATGLPVVRAEHPEACVIHGAGRILDELDLLDAVAC